MIFCGTWEHYGLFRFEWIRSVYLDGFGIGFEIFTFATWNRCLPLPKGG